MKTLSRTEKMSVVVEFLLWAGLLSGVFAWFLTYFLAFDLLSMFPAREWSSEFQHAARDRAEIAMLSGSASVLVASLCGGTLWHRLRGRQVRRCAPERITMSVAG